MGGQFEGYRSEATAEQPGIEYRNVRWRSLSSVGSASSGGEAHRGCYELAKGLCANPLTSRIKGLKGHLVRDADTTQYVEGSPGKVRHLTPPYELGLVHRASSINLFMLGGATRACFLPKLSGASVPKTE